MKNIIDLNLGFNDAENYKRRENKEFFNKIFLIDDNLSEILNPNKCFLVGEKGTGKTAYAVYLTNNNYKETNSSITYIRETDYKKFINLKKVHNLILSDYKEIWTVILLSIIASNSKKSIRASDYLVGKVKKINEALDEYYESNFSVDYISDGIELIEDADSTVKVIEKHLRGGSTASEENRVEEKFSKKLLKLRRLFEEALQRVSINKSIIVFIDGIDKRPDDVEYNDYIDCIKGLAHATWELNNDFFSKIKGLRDKQIKVVLLLRPDLFGKMGLQNQNNKLRDNSILLEWVTKYNGFEKSNIFKMTEMLLANQQENNDYDNEIWKEYFPYKIWNNKRGARSDDPFIDFLRISFYRPRDIISMLDLMKENVKKGRRNATSFSEDDFTNSLSAYSSYLLGEIKDQLKFYYSDDEFENFLLFFEYLKGATEFTYETYVQAYEGLVTFLKSNNKSNPVFFETPDVFLQFLYEHNIICFLEKSEDGLEFMRWCFRERDYATISPKVKVRGNYRVHQGLYKALNLGTKIL